MLNEGDTIERGTHAAPVRSAGLYSKFYEIQFGTDEDTAREVTIHPWTTEDSGEGER